MIWLYPEYISEGLARSVFVCPSTQNFIGTNTVRHPRNGRTVLADMLKQADYKNARCAATYDQDLRGVSYEIYGFMNNDGGTATTHFYYGQTVSVGGIKKSERSVQGYTHKNIPFGLRGQKIGPTQIWLIFDVDRFGPGARNNIPDKVDDHGAEGGNILFCDGHVQWVKGGQNYPFLRDRSGRKPFGSLSAAIGRARATRETEPSTHNQAVTLAQFTGTIRSRQSTLS